MLGWMAGWLVDSLRLARGGATVALFNPDQRQALQRIGEGLDCRRLFRLLDSVLEARAALTGRDERILELTTTLEERDEERARLREELDESEEEIRSLGTHYRESSEALERARCFEAAVNTARDTIQNVAQSTHRRWAEHLNQRVSELLQSVGALKALGIE